MNRVRFLGLLAAAPLALAGKAKAATDFRTENKAIESFTYGNVARAYDLREFGGGLTPKFFQQVNRDGLLERRIPHTVLVGEHPQRGQESDLVCGRTKPRLRL